MADEGTSRRSENYSINDEIQLCHSWMHISQDPIVGAQQRVGKFWEQIKNHYMVAIGEGIHYVMVHRFIN